MSLRIKNNKSQIILFTLFAICASLKSYGQISIFPTNDTYTSQANPDFNFGSDTAFQIQKSYSGNDEARAYLTFDLSTVNGNFEQILLKLYSPNSSSVSTQLRVLPNEVDETSMTWNNQASNSDFLYHGGVLVADTIYFDITKVANEKIVQSETLNLLLYSHLISNASQTFLSKESNNAQGRPQIVLLENTRIEMALFGLKDTIATTVEEGIFNSIILETTNQFEDQLDEFGGLIQVDTSYDATGYFRTELIDGIWHFINPIGNIFYSVGLNSVTESTDLALPQDLKDLGINTLGSWSDETITEISYCPQLNILRKFQNEVGGDAELTWDAFVLPVFEEDFASYVNANMPDWLAPFKDDPYVLGYFLDNELKFSSTQLEKSLLFATSNDQYIKANEFMIATYGAGYSANQVTDDDEMNYLRIVANQYFSITTEALRNIDPNHLIIGTRLNGNIRYRIPILELTSQYCDVMSINYYREWEIKEEDWILWSAHTDIPWMTTEFYTKGLDVEGNLDIDGAVIDNEDGAGWKVPTQKERAIFFENYVIKTLTDPRCIGFHWFRFIDNNGSNKGLFDANYETYPALAESFLEINRTKYALRESRLRGYSSFAIEDQTVNTLDLGLLANSRINIYPNPVSELIHIDVEGQVNYQVNLYDLDGKLIKSGLILNQLYVNGVPSGTYLIEIKDSKTGQKTLERIVITK